MSEPVECDAADYATRPADWGTVSAVVIYSAKKKPRWWQWRKRRQWFKPILFNVDDGSAENGTFTVDNYLTITLDGGAR